MKSFRGGTHIPDNKQQTANIPIEIMPVVPDYYVSLAQHIGKPAEPIVEVGQLVKEGELIAKASGFVSANIHSPVCGTIVDIGPYKNATGATTTCIHIKPTGEGTLGYYEPLNDPTAEQIVARIAEAGIVGMGGAGFPTAVKLQPKDKVDTLVINGVECEPYLNCDNRLMLEKPVELLKGIRLIAKALGVSKRTLYELFEDKEELLYHSIRFMQRRRMTTIEAKMKESRDTLAYLFESVAMMMDNKDLHRRISNNLRKFYPATFERVRKEAEEDSGKILYSLIEHYIDCGLIVPTVDIRLSVTILYYTATTLVTTADNMSLPAGVSLEDALTYTIINFFRGIATIEGVRQIDEYFCRKKQQRENDNNI